MTRLCDMDPEHVARLRQGLAKHTQRLANGCLPADRSNRRVVIEGETFTFSAIGWLLRHGNLPQGRLRRACCTTGCCEGAHLALIEPMAERRTRLQRNLSETERAEIIALRQDRTRRYRLRDIAERFDTTIKTVHRTLTLYGGR